MPRTTTLELPGCPPMRALTFNILAGANQPQVVTAAANTTTPKVVETWGAPDISRCKKTVLLAVVRKNCQTLEDSSDYPISGLHLFRKENLGLSSRSCSLLTCTEKGNAILRSLEIGGSLGDSNDDSRKTWNVCSFGNIFCSAVDGNENYAVFGGKGVEINIWDLESCTKIWNPKKDSLNIFTPTWFTAATFLSKDDHRKICYWEVLGCFIGKCSGSIRSIVRHPEFPMIASCGLDSYLRFWDIKIRQPLSSVFLKQHLTKVVFDSNFCDKVTAAINQREQVQEKEEDDEDVSVRRKKSSRENVQEKELSLRKKKKKPVQQEVDDNEDDEQEKQLKPKKKKKKPVHQEVDDNEDDEQEKQLKPKKKRRSLSSKKSMLTRTMSRRSSSSQKRKRRSLSSKKLMTTRMMSKRSRCQRMMKMHRPL
ncbi:hypothetical protein MKX01_018368 [Papaver californicum]|nr:hypothetical protein MKX01_018368 [Papaver californicum]